MQTAELLALQMTLEARWQEIQGASDQGIKHLAGMYSAMKPDAAGSIFNQIDPAFAAGFLRLIAANMGSKKPYVIRAQLATMNADVRNAPDSLNDGEALIRRHLTRRRAFAPPAFRVSLTPGDKGQAHGRSEILSRLEG